MTKLVSTILAVALAITPTASQTVKGLAAEQAYPGLADKMALFAQFVGDWEADAIVYNPDGSKVTGKAEWHWSWILEGRALQDVYILRSSAAQEASRVIGIGTGVRFPETKSDGWRVVYIGPMNGFLYTFSARKVGDEIVLEGKDENDAPMRWIFSEIKRRSFHWRAEVSQDAGKSWQLAQEMSVRRTGL